MPNDTGKLTLPEARRDRAAQYRLADFRDRRDREGLASGEAAIWQRYEQAVASVPGLSSGAQRELLKLREQAVRELEAILPVPPSLAIRGRDLLGAAA